MTPDFGGRERATVAVLGGGYGGIAVAKALDDVVDVLLVEPKDMFVHNVAALRGLVRENWAEQLFLPYDNLLRHGRVYRDRAVSVDGTTVSLGGGERIDADYVVLATGSHYPFPAKLDFDTAAESRRRLAGARAVLESAREVLLLGAGPVGLELAGEIRDVWPRMGITIVDPAANVVPGGLPDSFRAELRRQLRELDVELLLGTTLAADPPSPPGESGAFEVSTSDGRVVRADVWFRCYGGAPNSDYLAGDLRRARRPDGRVEVTAELRVPAAPRVFAIGDITAIPEAKMAKAAELHAEVVAGAIRAETTGHGEPPTYRPAGPGMSLPLGSRGGASYNEQVGVLGAAPTAQLKGSHLRIDRYRTILGLAEGPAHLAERSG